MDKKQEEIRNDQIQVRNRMAITTTTTKRNGYLNYKVSKGEQKIQGKLKQYSECSNIKKKILQ